MMSKHAAATVLPAFALIEDGHLLDYLVDLIERKPTASATTIRRRCIAKFGTRVVLYRMAAGEPQEGPMPNLRAYDQYITWLRSTENRHTPQLHHFQFQGVEHAR